MNQLEMKAQVSFVFLLLSLMFIPSDVFAQKIELTDVQIGSVCDAVRVNEKGIHIEEGINYWRYQEQILEYLGTTVEDEFASEKITNFILDNYYQIQCQQIQHFYEGYLLEQFAWSDTGDGYTTEFVISNHINVYEMMHSDNQTFMEWMDEKIESHITSEVFKKRLTVVRDELNLLMDFYPFSEENIEAFYEAQWDF